MSSLNYRHIDRHERRYLSTQYLNTPGYTYVAPHLDFGNVDMQFDNNQYNITTSDTKKHKEERYRTDIFHERPNYFRDERYNNPISMHANTYRNSRNMSAAPKFIDNRSGRNMIPGVAPIQPGYADRSNNRIDKQTSALKY